MLLANRDAILLCQWETEFDTVVSFLETHQGKWFIYNLINIVEDLPDSYLPILLDSAIQCNNQVVLASPVVYSVNRIFGFNKVENCLLYTSPSPRDKRQSRMPSSA